jgi:hypothetical protein
VSTPDHRRFVIKPLTVVLLVVAVVLAAAGVMYLVTPAGQLPSLVPGHLSGSSHHHTTHALLMFILAALALVGAWFTTNPASDRSA